MENINIGYPEQGGDAVDIGLVQTGVHLCVGGTSYGSLQIMVYDGENLIAAVDIKKMDAEEAPGAKEPYLVSIYDGEPGAEPDDEVIVEGLYN